MTAVGDSRQAHRKNVKTRSLGTPCKYFTGRHDIRERLDAFFSPRNTGGKPRREFLLFGMGGVGKSQIALQVAQDLEDRSAHSKPSKSPALP
jgi:Holliday junction resolvasome RuvABC ATP-dependent DNA helicase subunit